MTTLIPKYYQGATGSVNRAINLKFAEMLSVKDFGATGNGSTDDTSAIQAAVTAAVAAGKAVFFPAGTYMVNINTSITLEGGTTYCSLVAVSGMQLIGEGFNLSTIKLLANQSSNASPKKFNIIAGNTVMSNILIERLGFDINGANNKINGVVNGGVGYTCAAFICSGSVSTVGVDARLINAKFKDLYIANTPGTTCIGTGQSNSVGYTLGKNIEISGCIFNNNGLDTYDHSSVYTFSENVDIHDNVFGADSMATLTVGGRFACELHGARNLFHNNDIYNYNSGVYISTNLTNQSASQSVSDNTFYTANTAIQAFLTTSGTPTISDVIVNNNRILMSNDNQTTSTYKYAIDMSTQYGGIVNCIITDNNISTTDTYGAVGIRVGSQTSGYTIYGILISDNLINGFSIGISLGLTSGGIVTELDVKGNSIVNVVTDTLTPTYTQGISVNGPITQLNISNNSVFSRANQLYYGIYAPVATGVSVSNLYMESNNIDANATSAIYAAVVVSGRRAGIQAVTFAALPTTSTWKIGDVAYNSLPTVTGSASSQYVITSWSRLTNGTSNTLNTDWVQNRALTGT